MKIVLGLIAYAALCYFFNRWDQKRQEKQDREDKQNKKSHRFR